MEIYDVRFLQEAHGATNYPMLYEKMTQANIE